MTRQLMQFTASSFTGKSRTIKVLGNIVQLRGSGISRSGRQCLNWGRGMTDIYLKSRRLIPLARSWYRIHALVHHVEGRTEWFYCVVALPPAPECHHHFFPPHVHPPLSWNLCLPRCTLFSFASEANVLAWAANTRRRMARHFS